MVAAGALFLCLAAAAGAARAETGPRPPCAGDPIPPYAAAGQNPAVVVWSGQALAQTWTPAPCLEWRAREFDVLVAAAGRFAHAGGPDGLLRRIGAASAFASIRYWSVTRQRWRPLISEARALAAPDPARGRADFTPEELASGHWHHLYQEEATPAGAVVYRLRVRARSAEHLDIEVENALPARVFPLGVLEPGTYQFRYMLSREAPGLWRAYSLMRVGPGLGPGAAGFRSSYVNRAVAIFRYIAGIPTDREPPAAP